MTIPNEAIEAAEIAYEAGADMRAALEAAIHIIDAALSHAHAAQSDEGLPDYVYDQDDWEFTHGWDDRDLLVDDMPTDDDVIFEFRTLRDSGPVFARFIQAPDDAHGSWNWFRTRAEAEAASPPSKQEGA